MSDEDERQLNSNSLSHTDVDNRRRLSEIKNELQGLMRQKKKYDEEKLKQEADFLQSEINDLRNSISDVNKEIINQTQTKKKLHVQMTNLRSRSRVRSANLAIALRDKRRYEAELKKENKTEEYRELARREIQAIDAAIPILKKEDEFKALIKEAEDAQQAATTKRKKLEDSLNKDLRKQSEVKQLLSENADKLPQIETTIENLRGERERLLSSTSSSTPSNSKKSRRRLSSYQQKSIDSPTTDSQTPSRSLTSHEEDFLESNRTQCEEQLNNVKILLNYFREKLNEHGLNHDQIFSTPTPTSDLISPLYHPITPYEEQTILSSYMDEQDPDHILTTKSSNTIDQPTTAIAMKLPRNFAPLNLNLTTTNEIIHSPYYDGNEIEYKKEFSSDILDKYGGQTKKSKQQSSTHKKQRKNKKTFGITHNPQMIVLYNTVRGSADTLPPLPMFEYELSPTIQAVEFLKSNLESYLNEPSLRSYKISHHEEEEDIRDSALDTVSETSSTLIEPVKQVLETCLSTSSDEKKTVAFESLSTSNKNDDQQLIPTNLDELNSQFELLNNNHIDRQISDEGYRSVQNDPQQQQNRQLIISHQNSPLLDSKEKVGQWLSNTAASSSPSSLAKSITYQNDFQI